MIKYVAKQLEADVEVITPDVFDGETAEDPGFMKYASIGDYLVTLGGVRSVMTPVELNARFEPKVEGPSIEQQFEELRNLVAPAAQATIEVGQSFEQIKAFVQGIEERVAKLETRARVAEAAPPPESKPQTGKPK